MHLNKALLATLIMAFTTPSAVIADICGGTIVTQEGTCHNSQDAQVCYDGVDEILCQCPTGVRIGQGFLECEY